MQSLQSYPLKIQTYRNLQFYIKKKHLKIFKKVVDNIFSSCYIMYVNKKEQGAKKNMNTTQTIKNYYFDEEEWEQAYGVSSFEEIFG